MRGGFLNFSGSGRTSRRATRCLTRDGSPQNRVACEQLEARNLLATVPGNVLSAASIRVSVEVEPNQGGAVNVTLEHSRLVDEAMRIEVRRTAGGIGFRQYTDVDFEVDLDPDTPGVQAFSNVSRLTILGGPNNDTIVLDEHAGQLASEFVLDGLGGNDRVEHWRDPDFYNGDTLVDFNASIGRIEFVRDGENATRQVRAAWTSSLEEFAFYGRDLVAPLIVRTGSGHADRVEWQPGRFDLRLGPTPESATPIRVAYSSFQDVWLLTAGGADTVTIHDVGYRPGTPEAEGQGWIYHRLHVGTQDENDLIQWNLGGTRPVVDISIDGGAGAQNRLEIRSYRAQSEEFVIHGSAIGYFDPADIERRNRQRENAANNGSELIQFSKFEPLVEPRDYRYDDIQQLYLATGGGDDTIVVDERGAIEFPLELTILAQDDHDGIEVNLARSSRLTTLNIDGGRGQNGLTQFVRQQTTDSSQAQDDYIIRSAFVRLRGNEISTDYFTRDRRTMGPASIPIDESTRDALIRFQNIAGVTIVTLEQGNVELDAASTDAMTRFIQLLARSDLYTTRLNLGESTLDKSMRVDATGQAPIWLIVSSQNGDETVRIADNLAAFTNSAGIKSTLEFVNVSQLDIETGQGDDRVVVEQSAAGEFPRGLLLSTGAGDDSIDYVLKQPSALRTKLAVHGGAGAHDIFTFHDAPGNDLELRVDVDFYSQFVDIAADEVEYLRFFGGDGDDEFQNGTGIPSLLDGGAGNDTLFGGLAADVLYGGNGIDQLWGRDGRDALYPDYDARGTLFALSGDFLHGGKGDDLIVTRAVDQIVDDDGTNQTQDFPPLGAFDGTGNSLADCMCLLDHGLELDAQGRIASSGRGVMIGVSAITLLQPELEAIPAFTLMPGDD